MRIAICAIAKNENAYIREWVEYYYNLGITKIFLYDNNDKTGESFSSVISDYINSKFVEVIDFRGLKSPQMKAYRECYCRNNKDYDWMMFIDCDEFLTFDEGVTLDWFLTKSDAAKHSCILVNWVIYDDNDLLVNDGRPVQERFTRKAVNTKSSDNFYSNLNCKSIVRCGSNITTYGCHVQRMISEDYVDTTGRKLKKNIDLDPWFTKTTKLMYKYCHIKHYVTKTADEFYKRRISGTRPAGSGQLPVERRMKQFFSINKVTEEKKKILAGKNA